MASKMNDTRLTIGALARAAGISANTIRTWEKRYGSPNTMRTPGGHRVFPLSEVERLRLVQSALDRGLRPAQVVPLDVSALQMILEAAAPEGSTDALMTAVVALDVQEIDRILRLEYARRPVLEFLESFLVPFLHELGRGWEAGDVTVFQEHFASERISAFLQGIWYDTRASGQPVLLAALPGETHVLGLHMVAVLLAHADRCPMVLTAPSDPAHIVACATQLGSREVLLSLSNAATARTVTELERLIASAPDDLAIIIGGSGAPKLQGTTRIDSLASLWSQLSAG